MAFFESSEARIERLKKEGTEMIENIDSFKKVFQSRTGITISTIHAIKGSEFDVVIAYALLENILPNRNDLDGQTSAEKLLYVIASRARKICTYYLNAGASINTPRQNIGRLKSLLNVSFYTIIFPIIRSYLLPLRKRFDVGNRIFLLRIT